MKNKPKQSRPVDTHKVSQMDICQTPPHALEPLLPLLEHKALYNKNLLIWESAEGPERLLSNALRKHGFDVHGTDLLTGTNFFEYNPHDEIGYEGEYIVQVTNPPFSSKYKWIERSFELGFPFALIVPYETTFAAEFRQLFTAFNNAPWPIEVLSPERRINFKMPIMGWGIKVWDEIKNRMVSKGESAQMPTVWLIWGLNAVNYYTDPLHTYYVPMRNVKYNEDNTEIMR